MISNRVIIRAATFVLAATAVASLILFVAAGAYLPASLMVISLVFCGLGLISS